MAITERQNRLLTITRKKLTSAIAYLRTSSATNVGSDKDSEAARGA
jgi:hypothetical protein